MRKIILFVFLLTLAPIASFAATSCPSDAALETCSTNPGCYWNATTATCTLCPAGTYNPGTSISKTYCLECLATGTGTNLKWDDTTGLESTADCKWTANCAAGEYVKTIAEGCKKCSDLNNINTATFYYGPETPTTFTGTLTDGYPTNNVCKRCPDNSRTNSEGTGCECIKPYYMSNGECLPCGANASPNADGTNCNCNSGYHKTGGTNSDKTNVGTTNCVINQYTITLKHTNSDTTTIDYTTYKDDTTTVYNQTIKITGLPHDYDITLPSKDRFKRTGYELSVWRFSGGTFNPGERVTNIMADRTFEADWTGKKYTVRFLEDEKHADKIPPEENHYYDLTCTFGKGCYGQPITQIPAANKKGRIFEHWTCHKDSKAYGCTETEIGLGSTESGKIPEPNTEETDANRPIYKIYGVWTPCPAGYYCDGTQKNCPAGTTSDAGSDEKKDCYMLGGTTKIEGKNGTFTLPAGLNLYYRGS